MQAVIQYGKIVSWLEMEYGLSEKESKASESFLLAAFLNLAMCYLKLREYTKAVECCDKVKCLRGERCQVVLPHAWSASACSSSSPRFGIFVLLCFVGDYLFLSKNWEIPSSHHGWVVNESD